MPCAKANYPVGKRGQEDEMPHRENNHLEGHRGPDWSMSYLWHSTQQRTEDSLAASTVAEWPISVTSTLKVRRRNKTLVLSHHVLERLYAFAEQVRLL